MRLHPPLRRLAHTTLRLADPTSDVRGDAVRDARGRRIGVVHDLVIDESEGTVHALLVRRGWRRYLVNADRVHVVDGEVYVRRGAVYAPALTPASTVRRGVAVAPLPQLWTQAPVYPGSGWSGLIVVPRLRS